MYPPSYHIVKSGDYLDIKCAQHGELCSVHYRGLDPSVPLIEIVCPKCGSEGPRKLGGVNNEGWPELLKKKRKR
jgi:hypothetical protein